MKKVTALILIMAVASIASAVDMPKDVDRTDYVMNPATRVSITGELTDSSPTWHRWRPASYSELSLDCMLNFTSDYTTEPRYDLFCLEVTDSEPVEIVVDAASFDTVIYIYCDPFDPMNPTVNGVFMDDDDGAGLLSAIQASDGVTLTPETDYWLIICSYSSTMGTFSIQTSENVYLCGTVANEETSWGGVKGLFR